MTELVLIATGSIEQMIAQRNSLETEESFSSNISHYFIFGADPEDMHTITNDLYGLYRAENND